MRSVVCFDTGGGRYAVPTDQTRQVFAADGIASLPDPLPHVVGLLRPDDEALPVMALFGDGGDQVLMLEAGERRFGLLVEEVVGLEAVEAAEIRPAPEGQRDELVTGVIHTNGGARLLVDATTLVRRLEG